MTTSPVSSVSNSTILQNYIDQQKTAAATSSSSASATSKSITSVTGDFNTFLKILTTQLQNQDPMNATDTNQFTQELVQFSGVEQQINTNNKLDKIISSINSNGITPLIGYVGKTVETASNGQIIMQNGTANFSYTLPSAAQKVVITVKDSAGKTVATMNGPITSGVNRVTWDGKTSYGTQEADGVYSMALTATDSSGKALTATNVDLIGQVTGIQTASDGTTNLLIGNITAKATDITAVYSGVATASSNSSSST